MPRTIDITGETFSRLTVLQSAEYILIQGRRNAAWLCACDCGTVLTVAARDLKSGNTKSCGCIHRERMSAMGRSNRTHGMESHSLYQTWRNMVKRCTNPNDKRYERYGARGVSVHPEWLNDPRPFIAWIEANLGPRPNNPDGWHSRQAYWSLDRVDNDGNYEPGNLRWATPSEQNSNKSSARRVLVG